MRKLILLWLGASLMAAGAPRKLTLEEALTLALKQNRPLKLARLKADETARKRLAARADYYPKVLLDGNYVYFSKPLGETLTGSDLGLGLIAAPLASAVIPLTIVKQSMFLGTGTVGQPLTQLLKVRQGVRAAAGDEEAARAQAEKGEQEVTYAVEQLYYGALVAGRQFAAAELKVAAAEELLRDARNAVESGTTLDVAVIGRRAALLEAKQAVLAARAQRADYTEALCDVTGLALDGELELVEPGRPAFSIASAADAVAAALASNPEIREAESLVRKARAGVSAARLEYVPDVTAFGQVFHQAGMPSLPGNFAAVGARLSYTPFDFGKRHQHLKERELQLAQAEENVRRIREKVEVEVRKGFRAVERSLQTVDVAREALRLRQESERLQYDQFELGLAPKSAWLESRAARGGAEADLLRAEAGWRLALADLKRMAGMK